MRRLINWLGASFRPQSAGSEAVRFTDQLEPRTMLAGTPGPRVVDVFADNRGQAVITLDQPLNPATVNGKSVQILVKNKAKKATITYDAASKRITISALNNLKKNTIYTLKLKSSLLKSVQGQALDGEFKGDNKKSGNGKAGGDFVAKTRVIGDVRTRISTDVGNMDLDLFERQTKQTVKNFQAYANAGDWDGVFFHQLVKGEALFGGFARTRGEMAEEIKYTKERKKIKDEPHPGQPGNVFGTIAMNRAVDFNPDTTEDRNSASVTWFLNLKDNRNLLDRLDGGYTAFGKLMNKKSKQTLLKIAKGDVYDANANFNALPVKDVEVIESRTEFPVRPADLFVVKRVSFEMGLTSVTPAAKRTNRAAAEPASAPVVTPRTMTAVKFARANDLLTGDRSVL